RGTPSMATAGSVFRFGLFEFDADARELRKAGLRIKLQDQPCQILLALLESPGRPVTREALRERLWPDGTFVDFDHGLNIAIAKIRDALDDDATTPRFLETLPRLGYRFIAPVEVAFRNAVQHAIRDGEGVSAPSLGQRRRSLIAIVSVLVLA